jgi:hypothetical protein
MSKLGLFGNLSPPILNKLLGFCSSKTLANVCFLEYENICLVTVYL